MLVIQGDIIMARRYNTLPWIPRPWVLRPRQWMSELSSFTSNSTHNRSFRRWVSPGNHLHWYWTTQNRQGWDM